MPIPGLVTQAHADVRELLDKLKTTVNSGKGATDRARELVRHMDSVESSYDPVALVQAVATFKLAAV